MDEELFPIEIDVEGVTIREVGNGWELALEHEGEHPFVVYLDPPDPLYDQLFEEGVLEIDGSGKVVRVDD